MKHHGLGFIEPMIHGLLQDRKYETRRLASISRFAGIKPGDHIFAKETFFNFWNFRHAPCFQGLPGNIAYKADGTFIGCHKWTPGMFMPKKFSRIERLVIDVRVEPLQAITTESAIAEGIERVPGGMWKNYLHRERRRHKGPKPEHEELLGYIDPVLSFRSLFEMINGLGSWDENPEVRVFVLENPST